MTDRYLMISAHDMRTPRKANVHFIAPELAKRGTTRFFSLGFSALSRLRHRDPRLGLEHLANQVEQVQGVDCYLWRTSLHPGNTRQPILQTLSPLLFRLYLAAIPEIFWRWVDDASVVLVESGIGVLLINAIRRRNPSARVIYLASDDLDTIQVDPYLVKCLHRSAHALSAAGVPSPLLARAIPKPVPTYFVPHGLDRSAFLQEDRPSPFGPGLHAVSVGSMLFDPSFFDIAVEAFPDVTFHVIGSGVPRTALPGRIEYYGEMPFAETVPFLANAQFGIAPYRWAKLPYYLTDTSMKLMQYEALGLPAVCPEFVCGEGHPLRFGYKPADADSIISAVQQALAADHTASAAPLSWAEVTERILKAEKYPELLIQAD